MLILKKLNPEALQKFEAAKLAIESKKNPDSTMEFGGTSSVIPPVTITANPGPFKQQISPKKLAANKKNAQKSTGPKTAAGKEKSRMNALKHFATAPVLALADPKIKKLVTRTFKSLRKGLSPKNEFEENLVEQMACDRVLSAIATGRLFEKDKDDAWAYFEHLIRYKSSFDRSFDQKLRLLQKTRELESKADATIPGGGELKWDFPLEENPTV